MRNIRIQIGGISVGRQKTWGYPNGPSNELFWIPVYTCSVTGTNDSGHPVSENFNVLRFGVQNKDGWTPKVVGLADDQTHIIKAWIPTYRVHSASSPENGAWQVYGNFLIHDGPDNASEIFATIGCIEIMGSRGFVRFNDLIIALSGSTAKDRDSKLAEIGRSAALSISYARATRPPLRRA